MKKKILKNIYFPARYSIENPLDIKRKQKFKLKKVLQAFHILDRPRIRVENKPFLWRDGF